MEVNPVAERYNLPEVYHLDFDGTHFEICLNPTYWDKYISFAGAGTHYAEKMGPLYIPPSIFGGRFGFHGCATVENTPGGFSCIRVPALTAKDEQNPLMSLHTFSATLSSVLFVLNHLLCLALESKEKAGPDDIPQLFSVRSHVGLNPNIHKVSLSFSASLFAIEFLTKIDSQFSFLDAVEEMEEHCITQTSRDGATVRPFSNAIACNFYNFGVMYFRTVGNNASLILDTDDFGGGGISLTSQNVENVFQQFNLLVGVASVWQLVRESLRSGETPEMS